MFKWYKLNFFRKITIWSRFNKDKNRYEHNHIENRWQTKAIPRGHKSWKSGTWLKGYGWLDYKNRVQLGDPIYLIKSIGYALTAIIILFGFLYTHNDRNN